MVIATNDVGILKTPTID